MPKQYARREKGRKCLICDCIWDEGHKCDPKILKRIDDAYALASDDPNPILGNKSYNEKLRDGFDMLEGDYRNL